MTIREYVVSPETLSKMVLRTSCASCLLVYRSKGAFEPANENALYMYTLHNTNQNLLNDEQEKESINRVRMELIRPSRSDGRSPLSSFGRPRDANR